MFDLGEKHGVWQMDSSGGGQLAFSIPRKAYLGAATLQHCCLHTLSGAVQMQRCKNPSPKRKIARRHQL